MEDTKTFKHLFEYNGHDFLMETTIEFRQLAFNEKQGYVPISICQKIRPIDLIELTMDDEDEL